MHPTSTANVTITRETDHEGDPVSEIRGARCAGEEASPSRIVKILGAGLVLGTASSPEKLDFIRSLGADDAIDYTQSDWPKRVFEKTNGRGVDVLLESIGGEVFEQNFECLAAARANMMSDRNIMSTSLTTSCS